MWQLQTSVRHYPWGSRTVIPELLGEPSPADRPYAELWVGAHPQLGAGAVSRGRLAEEIGDDRARAPRVVAHGGLQLPHRGED